LRKSLWEWINIPERPMGTIQWICRKRT